uniref:Uncharacterized protein n=1 Tax=Arundo donax TaxID=35708 RepID=A0A0A8ZUE2_ARUDO
MLACVNGFCVLVLPHLLHLLLVYFQDYKW